MKSNTLIERVIPSIDEKIAVQFQRFVSIYDDDGYLVNRESAANTMNTLHGYFEYLVDNLVFKSNPFKHCRIKRRQYKKAKESFARSDIEKIFSPIKNKFKAIKKGKRALEAGYIMVCFLMFNFGLRVSEALNLKWCDLVCNGDEYVLKVVGKGGKPAEFPMSRKIYDFIIEVYKPLAASVKRCQWLFPSPRKGYSCPLTREAVNRWLNRKLDMLGIKKEFSPHSFRRTAITYLIRGGLQPIDVQKFARHEDFNTTLIYYSDRYKIDPKTTNQGEELL